MIYWNSITSAAICVYFRYKKKKSKKNKKHSTSKTETNSTAGKQLTLQLTPSRLAAALENSREIHAYSVKHIHRPVAWENNKSEKQRTDNEWKRRREAWTTTTHVGGTPGLLVSCAFMNAIPWKRAAAGAAAAPDSWLRHVRRVTANWPPFLSESGAEASAVSLSRSIGSRASFVRSVVRFVSREKEREREPRLEPRHDWRIHGVAVREPWSLVHAPLRNEDASSDHARWSSSRLFLPTWRIFHYSRNIRRAVMFQLSDI